MAMGRRQEDVLMAEGIVRYCMPVIPIDFGNQGGEYETCRV